MSEQEVLSNLPSDIVVDILSRLPVQTIICCKCVRKSWLHLIETPEFVKSHRSKSIPGLLASENKLGSVLHRFFEFEEEIVGNTEQDYDDIEVHKLHYNPATPWFDIPCDGKTVIGSANGLLFWYDDDGLDAKHLFICNPITREYIKIPCENLSPQNIHGSFERNGTYGFGASKVSGQHKVLRASRTGFRKFEYQIYTVGTGAWRRIEPSNGTGLSVKHADLFHGPFLFLKGKLLWLSSIASPYIASLDLETEVFSHSGCPLPLPLTLKTKDDFSLCVLRDSLCLCDATKKDEIAVWLVKEDKFWVRELVFRYNPPADYYCPYFLLPVHIVKVFEDGDILVEWCNSPLFTRPDKIGTWDHMLCWGSVVIHTPSFLSLKSFEMENVISY